VRIILLVASLLIVCTTLISCTSTGNSNPTTFAYNYSEEFFSENTVKTVVLSPVNMGVPAPSYLQKGDRKVKAMVKDFIAGKGIKVLPDYHFENAWKQAIRTYGDIYDPSTGKVNLKTWRSVMYTVGEKIKKETDADAIIFADLIVHDAAHSGGSNHYARWYGVTRKPSTRGTGSGIPLDFNWSQAIDVASLQVSIFDTQELKRIFTSVGGLDTLEAIDMRSPNTGFTRRKNLLNSEGNIEEGIEIAFHPFIKMKKYPGPVVEKTIEE
jgi:hypothetical protein